jgi:hypothetical protein
LGYSFNQSIDNLPLTIQNLTLGHSFNQSIDNLPNGIQNLTLSCNFNQEIDNLPSSINKITFHAYKYNKYNMKFNQEIKKIPQNLKIVDISEIPNKSDLKKLFEKFDVKIIE